MWEAMFSQNHAMEKALREVLDVLHDWELCSLVGFTAEDNCIGHLAVSYRTRPCCSSGLRGPLRESRPIPHSPSAPK